MADRDSIYELPAIGHRTRNCIVTGEPAKIWGGHVILRSFGPINADYSMTITRLGILAGFADSERMSTIKSDDRGCFGVWKKENGIIVEFGCETLPSHVADGQASGAWVSIETSYLKRAVDR